MSNTQQRLKSWGGLLWTSTPSEADKQKTLLEARRKLEDADELILKRQTLLRKRCALCVAEARQCMASKDRTGAKACLRQRKQWESEYAKLTKMREVISTHELALESAVLTEVVFNALKSSVEAMRTINGGHASVQDVDKLIEKLQDHSQNASEISDALSQPLDANTIDEDELERELNALMKLEEENSELVSSPPPRHPPSSPALHVTPSSSSSDVQSVSSSSGFARSKAEQPATPALCAVVAAAVVPPTSATGTTAAVVLPSPPLQPVSGGSINDSSSSYTTLASMARRRPAVAASTTVLPAQ